MDRHFDQPPEGPALGLSLSKRLVHAHKGVWIGSQRCHGPPTALCPSSPLAGSGPSLKALLLASPCPNDWCMPTKGFGSDHRHVMGLQRRFAPQVPPAGSGPSLKVLLLASPCPNDWYMPTKGFGSDHRHVMGLQRRFAPQVPLAGSGPSLKALLLASPCPNDWYIPRR